MHLFIRNTIKKKKCIVQSWKDKIKKKQLTTKGIVRDALSDMYNNQLTQEVWISLLFLLCLILKKMQQKYNALLWMCSRVEAIINFKYSKTSERLISFLYKSVKDEHTGCLKRRLYRLFRLWIWNDLLRYWPDKDRKELWSRWGGERAQGGFQWGILRVSCAPQSVIFSGLGFTKHFGSFLHFLKHT